MTSGREQRGHHGEQQAESWLKARGLAPLERNYNCRGGEIDLIMLDRTGDYGEVLVFAEVRVRAPGAQVGGLESVDQHKRRRLIHAAQHFLMEHPHFSEHLCRFDVIGIDGESGRFEWIADAFELE